MQGTKCEKEETEEEAWLSKELCWNDHKNLKSHEVDWVESTKNAVKLQIMSETQVFFENKIPLN